MKLPNPVICLPGIMGSTLRDEYAVVPETVWSPLSVVFKNYERITPHPSDLRYELREPARIASDHVFSLIYSDFIEELRHNLSPQADMPVPVFPFAYDWRQPLEDIESALSDFVDEVIGRTQLLKHYYDAGFGQARFPAQVNLVGHSMGGLLIAGYLQKQGAGKVNRVASIGSPFRGSLEAIAKVAVGVAALGDSPGSSRERETARLTPALYYLLPSFKGAVRPEQGLSDDLFVPDSWQPGILASLASFLRLHDVTLQNLDAATLAQRVREKATALLTQMLDSGWKHRRRLERLSLDDPKTWLCIVGVNSPTRVSMAIQKDESGQPRFDLSDDDVVDQWTADAASLQTLTGDTSVPYLGARSKFIPVEQIVCVKPGDFSFWEFKDQILQQAGFHVALPNLNLVQRLVVSHFLERPYGNIWGRPAPDLEDPRRWDPPIPGLPAKAR